MKINLQLTYNHEGSLNNISDETRLSCQASHKLSHSTLISNHIFSCYVFSNVCEQNINGISEDDEEDDDEEEDDDDDDLFVNPNHQRTTYYVESDSSDTSDKEP